MQTTTPKPTIGITLGDPGGIGPEVIAKAISDPALRALARWRIFGPRNAWESAAGRAALPAGAELATVDCSPFTGVSYGDGPWVARSTAAGGEVSYRAVEDAAKAALLPASDPRHLDAIVTGPISKEAWALAGHARFPGHTELLASLCGCDRFGMFFHCEALAGTALPGGLNVILATIHIPLAAVAPAITRERVLHAIRLGQEACASLGIASPRIAVCGVNPHAGEHGLLGAEDDREIRPAIEEARAAGIDASGPHPGDTIFIAAARGDFDLVVAMYHDQGLIPVKLLARDRTVNVTVGLPIVRTSPDHGTAFDIAGRWVADAGSTAAAMRLAARLARAKR